MYSITVSIIISNRSVKKLTTFEANIEKRIILDIMCRYIYFNLQTCGNGRLALCLYNKITEQIAKKL